MNKKVKKVLRKVLNANYHTCALSVYLVKSDRSQLMPAARKVQNETGGGIVSIIAKMMISNFVSGCNFWEYYNLKFYNRTLKNQNTFLTTYYNSVLSHRYNSYEEQETLYNKAYFNTKFARFRNLDWILMSQEESDVRKFFEQHDDLIFKPYRGECGHGVFAANAKEILTNGDFSAWLAAHRDYICEERITNDERLNVLNSTSLNTIRVITFLKDNECHIIWAGIRIGKKGSVVDNISEGGSCAAIDLGKGCIISEALDEHHEPVNILGEGKTLIGFAIPRWDEMRDFIVNVSRTLPQMSFVAWDIAITPKGLVLIEGNHGVSNTISQVHIDSQKNGLRNEIKKYL